MERYFNNKEFRYALDTLTTDPWLTVQKLSEYFEKYPKDYSAYAYYIIALICIRRLDEAEETLNKVENMVKNNPNYQNDEKYSDYYLKDLFFARIKLYLYQERFQEAYDLYRNHPNLYFTNSEYIMYVCKKKLGLLTEKDSKSNVYTYNQIIKYSKNAFLEHIKRHLYDYQELKGKNEAIFASDFPLEDVLRELPKYLTKRNEYQLFFGYYDDTYIFRLDNCGKIGTKTTNYFKVVCFHNTQNIITMYPTEECAIPYIDLNDSIIKDEPKVKTLSQIDKFNRRYQRKG